MRLDSQPTSDVTVTVTSDNTAAATVDKSSLTFTTSDWDRTQTVTVTGVQDADTADEIVTVSLGALGGGYGSVSGSVVVDVTDDDTSGGRIFH